MLYGPCGTGKDHLLIGLAKEAIIRFGTPIRWANAQEVFQSFRDAISAHVSESEIVATRLLPHSDETLTINRIIGIWRADVVMDKDQNSEIWNEQEKKLGYPEDVLVTLSYGGTCSVTQPEF